MGLLAYHCSHEGTRGTGKWGSQFRGMCPLSYNYLFFCLTSPAQALQTHAWPVGLTGVTHFLKEPRCRALSQ